MFIYSSNRPEQKENKEGDDKEKTAEQDKNDKNEELEKDKDKVKYWTKTAYKTLHLWLKFEFIFTVRWKNWENRKQR